MTEVNAGAIAINTFSSIFDIHKNKLMKKIIMFIEKKFEDFASAALKVYGNPFTFMIAFILVVIYLSRTDFRHQSIHRSIGEIMTCISFLIFFLIQKSVNRYSLALQVKLNELLVSHDTASSKLVHAEHKTETELKEIAEKYLKEHLDDHEEE